MLLDHDYIIICTSNQSLRYWTLCSIKKWYMYSKYDILILFSSRYASWNKPIITHQTVVFDDGYLFIIVAKCEGMNDLMDLYHNCYEYILQVLFHKHSYNFVHTWSYGNSVNFAISIFSTYHFIIILTVLFILTVTVLAYTLFVVCILCNFYDGF